MNLKTLLLAGVIACNSPQPTDAPLSEQIEVPQAAPLSFTLGGVTFDMGTESGMNSDQRKELIEKATSAYEKLLEHFGTELMSSLYVKTVKVQKVESNSFKARINPQPCNYKLEFVNEQLVLSIPDSEQQELKTSTSNTLYVNILEEETLLHEFIHLFLQGGEMTSFAFMEGLAHGLTYHLYPDSHEVHGEVVESLQKHQNACINDAFKNGWDTNELDSQVFEGGVQGGMASRFLRPYWGYKWAEFFEQHPKFITAFFRKLREKREQGTIAFTKEQIIEIASDVEPEFQEWMSNEGSSIQDLETQERVFATKMGENIWLFNFSTTAAQSVLDAQPPWKGGHISTAGVLQIHNNVNGNDGYITGNPSFGSLNMSEDPGPTTYEVRIGRDGSITSVPFMLDVDGKCMELN
ncbi:MAG: hypothetical protein ACI9QC_000136 [Oceanicoccus sp.]|jgi:hypothetical protein